MRVPLVAVVGNVLCVTPNEAVKKPNDSQNPNNFEGTCPLSLREIVAYTLF
jgi:hypothetical protein